MRKSGLSDRLFRYEDVVMHLACFLDGNLLKQHAAVLVERIVGDCLHLSRYDMFAASELRIKNGSSGVFSKIINIREILKVAPLDDENKIKELYDDNKFEPDFLSTYVVSSGKFAQAKDWFLKDQINTALGIAESFLKAEKDNPERSKYFVSGDKLRSFIESNTQPDQVSPMDPIDVFLNACAQLVEDIESSVQPADTCEQARVAAYFLKTVNTTCKDFLKKNIEKMHKDNYLSEKLKNYRNLGSGPFLFDPRPGSSRKLEEPVNCTRWVKDFFEAAEVPIKTASDVPKKAAKSPNCLIL